MLVVGGLAVAGVLSAISNLRTRQAFRAQRERELGEARAEVSAQVSAMADEILALTDRLRVAPDDEAERLFAEATGTYQQAQDHLERATTARELEGVTDELDHARWQLAAAAAMAEGRQLPPGGTREEACFFDPTHGTGTDVAEIDTAAGRRTVRVCSYCATKLRSGTAPEPRMIEVGGRRVPAAKAPRSHGGGGHTDLDDFTLVLDQIRLPYGWGGWRGGVRRPDPRGPGRLP